MPTRKIVLITLDYPPERGGVARYLGSLVAESNGAIEVIVESHHDMSGPGVIKNRVLFRSAWPRWWPLVRVCLDQRRPTSDARPPILLVSHVFPVGTAAWISNLFGGPPYAVIFHGLDLRRAANIWKRWLLRRIASRASALIVNSQATEQELKKFVPRAQPIIMTPGVRKPSADIQPKSKTGARVVSIARLVSRKGLDVAIRAMARIQRDTDVDYVIIGDGPDFKRLEDVVKEAGAHVRWISRPSDEEKWSWLSSADAFLLPVRDEGNDIEGFGIVFLEAGAAGVPSVAGRSGGAMEAVVEGETGLVVDPNSVDEVESAVRKLLSDETARRSMGERAKARTMRDFQWNDRWGALQRILI